MTVKELMKKYRKDYSVELQGKPLKEKCTSYTFLPKNKDLKKCEVVDFEIIEKEHKAINVGFSILGRNKIVVKKGFIRAYIR